VTSDRIAVMNNGRIEQVDAPFALYSRPKTRFVAGFIGRTNLIEARKDGRTIAFDGFVIDGDRFEALPGADRVTFSVRPHSLRLTGSPPAEEGTHIAVRGSVVLRSFLGEHWDYVFAPERSALRLKVAADASEVHEVGSAAWLSIDPKLMIAIS